MKTYPLARRRAVAGGRRMKADVEPARGCRPDAVAARRRPALARERVAVLRRREGDARRLLRHPQGRDPRHHRPQRRRQDVDAQRHQRLLSPAGGHDHVQGQAAPRHAALSRRQPGHRPHVPERRAVQGHVDARQHHDGAHAEDAARPRSAHMLHWGPAQREEISTARRSSASSISSRSRTSARCRSASCPTACRSASSSAARWPWSRSCCCSTSRWPA